MQQQVMQAQKRQNTGPVGDVEDAGMSAAQIGILQLNNLTYKLEPDLAVVVQRNMQSSFFLSQSYAPGGTMTAIINSGSAFVNLRQSYLVMDVQNTSGLNDVWFGNHGGSAANFINRIQIVAKNGVVLERIDNCAQLAACKVNNQFGFDWHVTVGAAAGVTYDAATLFWPNTAVQRFIIPLYLFSTLCDSMSTLCPSQLLSGARFEITLESASNSMLSDAGGALSALNYQITACRLDLESYLLTDSVMRVINDTAATQGLEVIAATTQNTQSQRTSSQIVVDVAKSCSRALSVIYKERPQKGTAATTNGYGALSSFDNVASAALVVGAGTGGAYSNQPIEWQVRAGQLYFPQSSLRSSNGLSGQVENELFVQTLRAFQKFYPGAMGQYAGSSTKLPEFRGVVAAGNGNAADGSKACFALDLQRSAILTSGIPLSNSHQLSINLNTISSFVTSNAFNYNVDVFLTYQICIRTFLSQAVLEV
jgi:hypothetical protein